MNGLETRQRAQISELLGRVQRLEIRSKWLFNRCYAITSGAICIFCNLSHECTATKVGVHVETPV